MCLIIAFYDLLESMIAPKIKPHWLRVHTKNVDRDIEFATSSNAFIRNSFLFVLTLFPDGAAAFGSLCSLTVIVTNSPLIWSSVGELRCCKKGTRGIS